MNIFAIAVLIVANTLFFLGVAIFLKNVRAKVNIFLGLACIASFWWLFSFALVYFFKNPDNAVLWSRLGLTGFVFIPIFLYHYIITFLDLREQKNYLFVFYLVGIVFALAFLKSGYLIKGVKEFFWGYYPQTGLFILVFLVFYLAIYARINYILYSRHKEEKKASPFKYAQVRYLFCTFVLLPISVLDFVASLGVSFYPSGYLFTFLGLLLIAISVLRYRLVDIDVVISKIVFLILMVFVFGFFHLGFVRLLQTVVSYGVANVFSGSLIVLVLFFSSIKEKLQNVIDTLIYKRKYEYQKALKETTQLLITKLDLNELCGFIIQTLAKNIGMLKASLFLEDEEDHHLFRIKAAFALEEGLKEKYVIHKDSKMVKWLEENRTIFIKEEIKQMLSGQDFTALYGDLFRISAEVIIPLFYRGTLIGLINLDNKRSGTVYNQADLDILEALANQAAVSIEKAKLYTEAVSDSLTKLYYHRYFQRRLEEELDRARRYSHSLSLLMVDIDGLKKINQLFGHDQGDRIIREVANVIKKNVRLTDLAARYSGEEFVILLPETKPEGAVNVAQRIKENVTKAIELAEKIRQDIEKYKISFQSGQVRSITVSIGVSNFNGLNGKVNKEVFLQMAIEALGKAKELGTNRVIIYNAELFAK